MKLYEEPKTCFCPSTYWIFEEYEIKMLEDADFIPYSNRTIYKHKTKRVYIFASEYKTENKIYIANSFPNYAYVEKIPIRLISVEQIKILVESIN